MITKMNAYEKALHADAQRAHVRAAMESLVAEVRRYAEAHYESDGWDYVVECYEDADIAAIIKSARTLAGAIRKVRSEIKHLADYRAEIQAERF